MHEYLEQIWPCFVYTFTRINILAKQARAFSINLNIPIRYGLYIIKVQSNEAFRCEYNLKTYFKFIIEFLPEYIKTENECNLFGADFKEKTFVDCLLFILEYKRVSIICVYCKCVDQHGLHFPFLRNATTQSSNIFKYLMCHG